MKALLICVCLAFSCFSQNDEFKCRFDKTGKRKTCTQKRRGSQGLETRILHYDADGKVTRIEMSDESMTNEDPGFETKLVYDPKGLLLKKGDIKYTYNSNGQLESILYHTGIKAFENKFLYSGKVLTHGFFTEDTGKECVYYNIKFDQKPLLVKDTLTWELKEEYLGNRIDSIFGFDKRGKLISAQRWYYDQAGHRVKRIEWGSVNSSTDPDKELVYLEQWKNNSYAGYTLICQVCGGGTITSTMKFDARGNILYDSTKQK